jgi:hypothetical protein
MPTQSSNFREPYLSATVRRIAEKEEILNRSHFLTTLPIAVGLVLGRIDNGARPGGPIAVPAPAVGVSGRIAQLNSQSVYCNCTAT